MTADPAPTRASPWTARLVIQLAVLAAAAFTYVTAEILPVGALTAMSDDLGVSEAVIGSLLAWYALAAALATVPLVRWTAHWPRRRALLLTLASLTVSQTISALAPNFGVLVAGRALCALTHGLLWAVLAPIAIRLVPPTHIGRATTAVYVGSSLGLVVGVPLMAGMSLTAGWRVAVGSVAVAAAAVLVAARKVLPPLPLTADQRAVVASGMRHHRNPRLLTICALTLIVVVAHFLSYTYILTIIGDVVGVHDPHRVSWLLAGYGVVGVVAMALIARPLDRRPAVAMLTCMTVLVATFVVLTGLAVLDRHSPATVLLGAGGILLWGAMAATVSPMLQSTAMRTAPADPDGASGLYVVAAQLGIAGGSLLGGLLFARAGVPLMLAGSTVLIAAALVGMAAARRLFNVYSIIRAT